MIEARHVTKKFKRVRAVDDLSFDLQAGGSLALWGSNGAGKTTLIRCLLGVFPAKGTIRLNGIDVSKKGKHARAMIGYVPQELAFHDDAKLGSAIRFFAKLRRVDVRQAAQSLALVGLSGHESKRVRDLSGGMKQRLALAIALIADPPIIVLDEPTSNLDSSGRGEVVDTLLRLRKQGKTMIFASHRPDEVITLADQVLVMEQGRLVQQTTPEVLWPSRSSIRSLRLFIEQGDEHHAAEILREGGFAVNHANIGLTVAIEQHRKAEPMNHLAARGIIVRDFELLRDVQQDDEPEHPVRTEPMSEVLR
ncbi:MAG: heme ABC transporter [Phycisphaerae bacterium]|nr:heme ABC transporter [Phycisphaerae bacterium]MBM92697.1 heme ABC transporter [Phycisphaerae bacterium]HCT45441.1 ABC transporter ATP-binding protein [Phycisphaerales bacterium]